MSPTSPVRVSVVVPVYNPGTHIDALIESLAAQSMPQQQFEVVFSDDGSTDETPGRLDQLAEERANVTVLHEPNSGWPGRPRNLGTDAAHGKYVFFVDQDDWLGEEALQRMCDYADENSSDVVSEGMPVIIAAWPRPCFPAHAHARLRPIHRSWTH